MRFLVDAQLPVALARWLSAAGIESEHVSDCGLLAASDGEIWSYAVSGGSVIVTKDEDFQLRRSMVEAGPAVVWVRLGNTRKGPLLAWFEKRLPDIVRALEDEPLRASIRAAFVYGSIAKGTDRSSSDIDLLVLADELDHAALFVTLQPVEGLLARRVNPTVFGVEDGAHAEVLECALATADDRRFSRYFPTVPLLMP